MLGTVSPALSFTTARHRELKKLSKVQDEVAQANFSEKRYVWVPDPKKGYELGYIVRDEANDDAVVSINGGEEFIAHITDLEKVNPPKFDRVEDMADLGYLNEASVV
ncbi:class II myosin, partial [Tieghemiomyces parasiticus]